MKEKEEEEEEEQGSTISHLHPSFGLSEIRIGKKSTCIGDCIPTLSLELSTVLLLHSILSILYCICIFCRTESLLFYCLVEQVE